MKTLPARKVAVALGAAALLTCSSKPTPLQVTVLATTITSPNPGVLAFWTDLDVFNPNPFPLAVVNVQSDLTIAEINPIPSESYNVKVTFPPHAHTAMRVPIGAVLDDVPYAPSGVGPVPYVISAWFLMGRPDEPGAPVPAGGSYIINGMMSEESVRALLAGFRRH
jgi:hypothetical protein